MVSEIADRIVVMEAGRIVEEGSVADIFDRPREAYTRNLLEAETTSDLLAQLGAVDALPEAAQLGA